LGASKNVIPTEVGIQNIMKRISYWLLPVFWAFAIFLMSSQQGVSLPSFPYSDKIAHLCVYIVFGYLVMRALVKGHSVGTYNGVILSLVIGTIYGFSDEVHQTFVPTRSAEFLDLFSDMVGSFIGALIFGYVANLSKKS